MYVSQEPSNWSMMQILSAQKRKQWRVGGEKMEILG